MEFKYYTIKMDVLPAVWETREGDHVHRKLAQVTVQLAREAQTARAPGEPRGDQVVQVSVTKGGRLKQHIVEFKEINTN